MHTLTLTANWTGPNARAAYPGTVDKLQLRGTPVLLGSGCVQGD